MWAPGWQGPRRLAPTVVASWAQQGPQTKSHGEPLAWASDGLGTHQGRPSALLRTGALESTANGRSCVSLRLAPDPAARPSQQVGSILPQSFSSRPKGFPPFIFGEVGR